VVERITVVKFRTDSAGSNGAGCFEIKVWTDTAKFTSVVVARFRKCRDFVGECEVLVLYASVSLCFVSVRL